MVWGESARLAAEAAGTGAREIRATADIRLTDHEAEIECNVQNVRELVPTSSFLQKG